MVCDTLSDGRQLIIRPDMIADFTALPFEDETFAHIVFDPPHLIHGGNNSWLVKKYGLLPNDWRSYLRAGFDECYRVFKTTGVLIFKWSEYQIPVREIVKVIGRDYLYGHPSGKAMKTHWLCFMKLPEGG